MVRDLENIFSSSSRFMKRSVIRELLKLTQKPDVISFAGGLPSPYTFPVETIKEVCCQLLDESGDKILQYSTTEGDVKLREEIIKHAKTLDPGVDINPENILITVASQQGLYLISKVFINRGDKLIVGLPSYLGGINAFLAFEATLIGVKLDDDGMEIDCLRERLETLRNIGVRPKFIYTVPDFQNPAGVTMSVDRRKQLLELAYEFNVLVIEDSPYRELRFKGNFPESLFSLDKSQGQVVQLGTFSKIFIPGFRLGWVIADKAIIERLVMAKQSMDLCTPAFNQAIAARYMEMGYLEKGIKDNVALYKEKCEKMLDCLEEYMPKDEGLSWTKPEGGLFLWVRVPRHINLDELFIEAAEKYKVAYVIGSAFHCDGSGKNTMRLNFSFPTLEQIDEGIKRLADLIRSKL